MTARLPRLPGGSPPSNERAKADFTIDAGVCRRQGRRPYQEDEFLVKRLFDLSGREGSPGGVGSPSELPTVFLGLFDGHAGGKCSKALVTLFPDLLVKDKEFSTDLTSAIKRTFFYANEGFLRIAERMKLGDGSCGVVSLLRGRRLTCGNVGDSRCIIVSGHSFKAITRDQKTTDPSEQRRITEMGGQVVNCSGIPRVNGVLAVARAFGNRALKHVIKPEPEMFTYEIKDGDTFLVQASDGLWDVLRNKDVADICVANSTKPAQYIADELVTSALSRGSSDNCTCIVLSLGSYRSSVDAIASTCQDSSSPDSSAGKLSIMKKSMSSDSLASGASVQSESHSINSGLSVGMRSVASDASLPSLGSEASQESSSSPSAIWPVGKITTEGNNGRKVNGRVSALSSKIVASPITNPLRRKQLTKTNSSSNLVSISSPSMPVMRQKSTG
jgi:protein phosphatase 1L